MLEQYFPEHIDYITLSPSPIVLGVFLETHFPTIPDPFPGKVDRVQLEHPTGYKSCLSMLGESSEGLGANLDPKNTTANQLDHPSLKTRVLIGSNVEQ